MKDQDDQGALRWRRAIAGLDIGQAGDKFSQARLAEVDRGELDESAAHGSRLQLAPVRTACTDTLLAVLRGRTHG